MKNFLKNNLTPFHWGSMVLCVLFAVIYWWKAGQFSDYWWKNRLVLMLLWGLLTGWITGDFLHHARGRKE